MSQERTQAINAIIRISPIVDRYALNQSPLDELIRLAEWVEECERESRLGEWATP